MKYRYSVRIIVEEGDYPARTVGDITLSQGGYPRVQDVEHEICGAVAEAHEHMVRKLDGERVTVDQGESVPGVSIPATGNTRPD